MDGTRGYGGRNCVFDWRSVHGQPLQQYYGYAAARLRVRECAAVCNLSARYVLETHHWSWRIHWLDSRNRGGGGAPRADLAGRRSGGNQGRLDRRHAHISERNGAEFLDGDLCVVDMLCGHNCCESDDART